MPLSKLQLVNKLTNGRDKAKAALDAASASSPDLAGVLDDPDTRALYFAAVSDLADVVASIDSVLQFLDSEAF